MIYMYTTYLSMNALYLDVYNVNTVYLFRGRTIFSRL